MNTKGTRPADGSDELLTPEDMAKRLKVSERTIERWQHDGTLPFLRLGQTVRFHWPAVVNHLLENFLVCRLNKSTPHPGPVIHSRPLVQPDGPSPARIPPASAQAAAVPVRGGAGIKSQGRGA